jgi:hypothetical protein
MAQGPPALDELELDELAVELEPLLECELDELELPWELLLECELDELAVELEPLLERELDELAVELEPPPVPPVPSGSSSAPRTSAHAGAAANPPPRTSRIHLRTAMRQSYTTIAGQGNPAASSLRSQPAGTAVEERPGRSSRPPRRCPSSLRRGAALRRG